MRLAKGTVVMAEPIYEPGSRKVRARKDHHGYVRDLKVVQQQPSTSMLDYRLLDVSGNPLNTPDILMLAKNIKLTIQEGTDSTRAKTAQWQHLLPGGALGWGYDMFCASEIGIA